MTMAASISVGSNVFAVLAVLVICLLVLLVLRYFLPLRATPAYLLLPVFLALALPASIILLVPIDLASTAGLESGEARGIWLTERVMLVAWRITYWLCFALTWFILPLLGEYADSGDRSPKAKLLHSLRQNGRYQLIVLGSCAVGLVYFAIQSGVQVTNIKALVMALAYCWGLILAIYLMGHGLVAVPRHFLRRASISGTLRRLQSAAPKIHDRLDDAHQELAQLEAQVTQLRAQKRGLPRDVQDWIEELSDTLGHEERRLPRTDLPAASTEASIPTVVTTRYLADLTRHLSRARHKQARFINAWDRLVRDAVRMQTILDSSASRRLDFGRASPYASILSRATLLTPYTRYLLHARVTPALRVACGTVLSLASICIVWSELIKHLQPQLSIISLTVVHHFTGDQGEVGFAGQVIAAAWILYMCAAALTSISDAKVWGNRALVRRNTYGESACWYASQTAKLTVPLAYNFITFLPASISRHTTFYDFLGRLIDLTPIGKGFDTFFPIFILFPVCATLFNLYGRVKRVFGIDILEDDDEENPTGYGTGGWREGRDLIERDLASGGPTSNGLHHVDPTLPLPPTANPLDSRGRSRTALPHIPNNASNRPAPTLTVPPSPSRGPAAVHRARDRPAIASPNIGPDDDDGPVSVFAEFAHRIQNTIDTTDPPRWMQGGFRRPKWMQGPASNSPDPDIAGGSAGDSPSEGRGLFGNLFRGRAGEGAVRL
ncbi:MAG: hypothetical protein M1838_000439 [Thelocarpon superellum]|nr:MAG: hypothetical protein M1838_000439 [Thelocarpon superellum]